LKSIEEIELQNSHIKVEFNFKIPKGQAPERLDSWLTHQIPSVSRTRIQKAMDAGLIRVNNIVAKASRKIQPGDFVNCSLYKLPPIELTPQDLGLEIVYEDEYLLVANKPAGMCTHPGLGNRDKTLVNGVMYHLGCRQSISFEIDEDDDEGADLGAFFASDDVRPGIVHRLDKDTSGMLIVSKNPEIHAQLQKQFLDRSISRKYYAIVWGQIEEKEGRIIGDIGRSSQNRKKFAVVKKGGKNAITDFKVIETFETATLVELKLQTGRTHQIRVHLSHKKYPIIGDELYGGNYLAGRAANSIFKSQSNQILKLSNRQLLHAKEITFFHPVLKTRVNLDTKLPEDMEEVLNLLKTAVYSK